MCLKKNLKSFLCETLSRKELSFNYTKFLLRGQNENNAHFLDTCGEIFTSNAKFLRAKRLFYPLKKVVLPHKLDSSLQIEYLAHARTSNTSIQGQPSILQKSFADLCSQQQVQSFLLLRSVKGGFRIYYKGITGFLPKSHMRLAMLNLKQTPLYARYLNLLSTSYSHLTKRHKIIRFPVLLSPKVTLCAHSTSPKFSRSRKIWHYRGRLNVVFLFKQTT